MYVCVCIRMYVSIHTLVRDESWESAGEGTTTTRLRERDITRAPSFFVRVFPKRIIRRAYMYVEVCINFVGARGVLWMDSFI